MPSQPFVVQKAGEFCHKYRFLHTKIRHIHMSIWPLEDAGIQDADDFIPDYTWFETVKKKKCHTGLLLVFTLCVFFCCCFFNRVRHEGNDSECEYKYNDYIPDQVSRSRNEPDTKTGGEVNSVMVLLGKITSRSIRC